MYYAPLGSRILVRFCGLLIMVNTQSPTSPTHSLTCMHFTNTAVGAYIYTSDLLALDSCRPPIEHQDSKLCTVCTPVNTSLLVECLSSHPDKRFVNYIAKGFKEGFRIGFDWSRAHQSANHNMPSAALHAEVIEENIRGEIEEQRLFGPFKAEDLSPPVHISRFGVIEKKHQPGKFRLIVDLSFPPDKSINDGISPNLCSLSYTKIDDVVREILALGPGTTLAKIDIKSAYRIVPVHPTDRHLLGTSWKGKIYVDGALPFGLRSAPKIFSAVADALEFVVKQLGVHWLWHYLDDFITIGRPDSPECAANLDIIISTFHLLNIPLALHKIEGPAPILTFLGILIDTLKMEMRLPTEKLERLKQLIDQWDSRKHCLKRELESLIGQLHHASTVVKPGRSFLRRMIELDKSARCPNRPIRLNRAFRSDLAWWKLFIDKWNGTSMLSTLALREAGITVISDASGSWGCGAFWGDFGCKWHGRITQKCCHYPLR